MKKWFGEIFKRLKHSKRTLYLLASFVLIIFCLVLSITFSAFTSSSKNMFANIKIGNLEYTFLVNGNSNQVILTNAESISKYNLYLKSNNSYDTDYEITYEVCANSTCTSFIETPEDLKIEYSSISKNPISGEIVSNGENSIRVVVSNFSSNNYYIKFFINAGYAHNYLEEVGDIISEYMEDDLSVITYINNEEVKDFPENGNYIASATCKNPYGATLDTEGEIIWNGTEWLLNVSNVYTGETRCFVDFTEFIFPTYTYLVNGVDVTNDTTKVVDTISSDANQGTIKFLTSGTLTFTNLGSFQNGIDVFLVGGGGGGASSTYACGGGGGYTNTVRSYIPTTNTFYVEVGAGGAKASNGNPSYFRETSNTGTIIGVAAGGYKGNSGSSSAKGGNGGSGGGYWRQLGGSFGNDGSNESNGGKGQISTPGPNGETGNTYEFGDSNLAAYAGGGSGNDITTGSEGGGGAKGTAGTANTGGGGGASGAGGSGTVIIRYAR